MIKLLIGGSPCTHWSIAKPKNRETEASGIGWELFLNYRIARDKYQPDYFLYENNKSMSPAIRAQITAELGVEPVLINSALVSAQNRQRLYWVGKREEDGTYSQVQVEQPEDRGVCLLDVLTADDLAPYNGGEFKKLKDGLHAKFASTWQVGKTGDGGGQAVRVYDVLGKSVTLKALGGGGGAKTGLYKIGEAIFALNAKGCEKLQTVPAGYTSCVPSNIGVTLLGNGWTVDVIAHIMSHFDGLTEQPLRCTGCQRTGCMFCGFGAHLEKGENRFQRMKRTHPRHYDFCIGGGAIDPADGLWKPTEKGLGYGKILDYIGVRY